MNLTLTKSTSANLAKEFAIIIAGSILIAACAQLTMPMWPVPVTGQTFGVLLVAALFGRKRGVAAVLAYLAEGAMGLPVFAGFSGTIAKFAGPTAGYLFSFIPAAYIVGSVFEKSASLSKKVIALLSASATILAGGALWLSLLFDAQFALVNGVLPFLPGAAVKVALVLLVAKAINRK